MATVVNDRDVGLQSTSPRLSKISNNEIILVSSATGFLQTASGIQPSEIVIKPFLTGRLSSISDLVWSVSPAVTYSISSDKIVTIQSSAVTLGTPVVFTATLSYLGVTYTSDITINAAAETVASALSKSTINVNTASDGTGGSYTDATSQMIVAIGSTDDSANWTYSWSVVTSGVTFGSGASAVTASGTSTRTITISAIGPNTPVVLRCTATKTGYVTQTKDLTLTKSLAGATAKLLRLEPTDWAFRFDDKLATSSTNPSSITFTANRQNITDSVVFTATAYDSTNSSLGSPTLTGTGDTRTLSAANFNSLGTTTVRYVKVTASAGGLSDSVTIWRGDNGSDALTFLLTNEAHVVPADSSGAVTSYTGALTYGAIFRGITNETSLWTITKSDGTGLTTTLTGTGTSNITLTATALANGTDSAVSTITATRTGYPTLSKDFSISKSKTGATGDPGPPGDPGAPGANGTRTAILDMYRSSSSTPTTFPSGTSTYTWSTGQFTSPATTNGWSLTPTTPAAGETLYIIRQVYSDSGTTATSSITWSATTPISISSSGTNGTRTAFLEVYQWAASTPSTFPSGTSTYTWATGAFTAPTTPNSWSLLPGASTPGYNLYACSVRYADTNTTATSTVTWNTSTAYVVGSAGSNGAPGDPGLAGIVQRIAYQLVSQTAGTPTYTASTSGGTTLPGASWQATVPTATVGNVVWYIYGQYNPNAVTYQGISANTTSWSAPIAASVFQDIRSDNWNGSSPPTGGNFGVGATSGYYLNKSEGSIYVQTGYVKGTLVAGSIITSTVTLSASGTTLGTIESTANTANTNASSALSQLSNKLEAGTSYTLTGVATVQDSGAIKVGSITWNSTTGAITGGTGVAFTENGIAASKEGVSTFSITSAGDATFGGILSAAKGTFAGSLIVGTTPAISGTTMTGSGAVINSAGTFALGNSTTNITFNGSLITLNGDVVATGNIKSGAVTTAKFASGIEPVTIVTGSVVPTIKSTESILLTGTSKLYRWDGTAYISTVPAVDLTGTITTAQISDTAITETKISDNAISTAKIAANAITAAKIAANTITASQIAANTITASQIAADTITAGQIAAGAISTSELAANAVTATNISAGAVSADKISVTSLAAINANMGAITAGTITMSSSGSHIKGGQTAYDAGTGFFLGYDSTTPKFSIGNSAGNKLTWDGSILNITGAITATSLTLSGGVTVPAASVSGLATVATTGAAANISGLAAVATSGNKADVALGNVSNLTPQNQAKTGIEAAITITSGGIAMSSGGYVKGGQTDYNTGTGFFLGYSTDNYKFSIGNSGGQKLTWDGTNLSITGAITATSLTLSGGVTVPAASVSGLATVATTGAAANISGLAAVATSGNKADVALGNVSNLTPQNQAKTGIEAAITITSGGIAMSSGGYVKGGQTDYNTGTGFFLGYSTDNYKFSIGNPSGQRVTWDGSTFTIVGTIDTTSIIAGTSAGTVVSNAAGALQASSFNTTLQNRLNTGVDNIIAGQGADYRLYVETTSNKIVLGHKDVITAYPNAITNAGVAGVARTYLAITSSGILMGYYGTGANATKTDSISINGATGNATFIGTVTATAGSFGGINIDTAKIYTGTGTWGNANTGFYADSAGQFSLKDKLTWNGTTLTIAGSITATSTFAGSLTVGTTPAISGTTMTGSGAVINSAGTFALGNSTTNITFNGSLITLNGDVVATGNIKSGAVTTAKFASGIEPITIVTGSVVPTIKSTESILLTGTSKLYRWDGTAYISTVPTVDLTGTITTAQISDTAITETKISDNAISTAKIAANAITAAKIAANTITASQIAANTITASQIAANTITASQIAANTITASQIAANTITASQIAADTITAGQIAAGAISTSELSANAVTATNISAGAVSADKISVTSLAAINANMGAITAGTITMSSSGSHIKGGQTAYDAGTGFFLGYDSTTPKFSIGNSAGNKLTWDGSILTIAGIITATSTIDGTAASTVKSGAASGATALQNNDTNKSLGLTGGSIGGATIASTKIYIGTGTWANANTGFYVDSTGQFSLKDKLTWDGTTLNIQGSLVTGATSAQRIEINKTELNRVAIYNTSNQLLGYFGGTGQSFSPLISLTPQLGTFNVVYGARATLPNPAGSPGEAAAYFATTSDGKITSELGSWTNNGANSVRKGVYGTVNYSASNYDAKGYLGFSDSTSYSAAGLFTNSQGSTEVSLCDSAGYAINVRTGSILINSNARLFENSAVACLTGTNGALLGYGTSSPTGVAVAVNGAFRPSADNVTTLGVSAQRWSAVWAANGTIQTSDENLKKDIRDLSTVEKVIAIKLKSIIKAYRWKNPSIIDYENAVVDANGFTISQGTPVYDDKLHIGIIAQQVINVFTEEGLNWQDYAIVFKDSSNRYSVSYTDLLAFIISAL